MPIFQSMLPLYIQAVKNYIEMNKQRYKFFTKLFYFDEYTLCEAKLKSAEIFIKSLRNELEQYKLQIQLQFIKEMQGTHLPERSTSMPIALTTLSSPNIATPKTCASIGENVATYQQTNSSFINSAATPIFNYLKKMNNQRVTPHPNGPIIRQLVTSNSFTSSPIELSNHSQNTDDRSSEDSKPNRSDNTAGFAHEQRRKEENGVSPCVQPIIHAYMTDFSEFSSSEEQESHESILFMTIKVLVDTEIDIIECLRLHKQSNTESAFMEPINYDELNEHPEGSYDVLLQTISANLNEVYRREARLFSVGENIARDNFFSQPYRKELLFNLERYLCIATFDKSLARHENITKRAENFFNLGSGFNSKNLELFNSILVNLEDIASTVFISANTLEQQFDKTIGDFISIINILESIPNISKQHIQPFIANLKLLREESKSCTISATPTITNELALNTQRKTLI